MFNFNKKTYWQKALDKASTAGCFTDENEDYIKQEPTSILNDFPIFRRLYYSGYQNSFQELLDEFAECVTCDNFEKAYFIYNTLKERYEEH